MIVYLLRNKANGKCYIGKTTGSLARRWTQHKCEARLGRLASPLYEDLRNFKEHCFEIEVLATVPTQRRLAQAERKFIRIFDAVNSGYNDAVSSFGGRTLRTQGSPRRKQSPETIRKIKEQNRRTWAQRKQVV